MKTEEARRPDNLVDKELGRSVDAKRVEWRRIGEETSPTSCRASEVSQSTK